MKNITIRTLREKSLVGNTKAVYDTESDGRKLASFIFQDIPASTYNRAMKIIEEYYKSNESDFSKFMKELK